MLPSGELGPVARRQLAAWEAIAADWPLYKESFDARVELCRECQRGVILIRDEQYRPYRYTEAQRLAMVVLHLRNHHPERDPDRG